MTRKEAAQLCGVSVSTIRRIEKNGRADSRTAEKLRAGFAKLGVDLGKEGVFIDGRGNRQPSQPPALGHRWKVVRLDVGYCWAQVPDDSE